jgi:hypothetical protein
MWTALLEPVPVRIPYFGHSFAPRFLLLVTNRKSENLVLFSYVHSVFSYYYSATAAAYSNSYLTVMCNLIVNISSARVTVALVHARD